MQLTIIEKRTVDAIVDAIGPRMPLTIAQSEKLGILFTWNWHHESHLDDHGHDWDSFSACVGGQDNVSNAMELLAETEEFHTEDGSGQVILNLVPDNALTWFKASREIWDTATALEKARHQESLGKTQTSVSELAASIRDLLDGLMEIIAEKENQTAEN